MRVPAKVKAHEVVGDTTQHDSRARKAMHRPVYSWSLRPAETEVVVEPDAPLYEQQGEENEAEDLVPG
jgi:hypothetical protein